MMLGTPNQARVRFTGPVLATIVLAAVTAAGCRPKAGTFPQVLSFGNEALARARAWSREGMEGAVYLRPGESLPGAGLQVGVIRSTRYHTPRALHSWIRGELDRSQTSRYHDSGGIGEACMVGLAPTGPASGRAFILLHFCSADARRAVCVEADEDFPSADLGSAIQTPGRFEAACSERWGARRPLLESLASQALQWQPR